MSTGEHTGHPINVANLEELYGFLANMGALYDPVNQRIKLPAIEIMIGLANGKLQVVKDTNGVYKRGTNDRELEFADIKKLCTRLVNALIACGATKLTVADAKTYNRKIQGGRAAEKISPIVPTTEVELTEDEKIAKNISVSQQNFDFVIDNFIKLVTLLINEPLYLPNEVALQTATLEAKIVRMQAKNKAVKDVTPAYVSAMSDRNVFLYKSETGLVDTSKVIKAYALSVLETSSEVYIRINSIHFKNFK